MLDNAFKNPDSIIITYQTMRKIIGFLGFALVPVLIIGVWIIDQTFDIKISVSAYYHSSMRDVFVGIVFGISFFLLCYHGYEWKDSLVSKLAGLFGICVVIFPTSLSADKGDISSKLHYISAGLFFCCLAYMSLFLFTKSAGNMTPEKKKRNKIYRICGITMAVSVLGIPITQIPVIHESVAFLHPTLIFEATALISFGFSWLTKGEFILKDS